MKLGGSGEGEFKNKKKKKRKEKERGKKKKKIHDGILAAVFPGAIPSPHKCKILHW